MRGDSEFETVEQLVETAKERPVSLAVSRLPHPGTIGLLSLAEATGAQSNIVPYGGGNPQVVAVLNGEVGAAGGGTSGYIEDRRILGVFDREEWLLESIYGEVPLINDVFGTDIPSLFSARSFGIHRSWADANPDQYQILKDTSATVFDEPQFQEDIEKVGVPGPAIRYRDQEVCWSWRRTSSS